MTVADERYDCRDNWPQAARKQNCRRRVRSFQELSQASHFEALTCYSVEVRLRVVSTPNFHRRLSKRALSQGRFFDQASPFSDNRFQICARHDHRAVAGAIKLLGERYKPGSERSSIAQ